MNLVWNGEYFHLVATNKNSLKMGQFSFSDIELGASRKASRVLVKLNRLLDLVNVFKCGAKDKYKTAFAIESQYFPDAPNHPEFSSIILKKGEKYQTQSIFKFSYKTED